MDDSISFHSLFRLKPLLETILVVFGKQIQVVSCIPFIHLFLSFVLFGLNPQFQVCHEPIGSAQLKISCGRSSVTIFTKVTFIREISVKPLFKIIKISTHPRSAPPMFDPRHYNWYLQRYSLNLDRVNHDWIVWIDLYKYDIRSNLCFIWELSSKHTSRGWVRLFANQVCRVHIIITTKMLQWTFQVSFDCLGESWKGNFICSKNHLFGKKQTLPLSL